MRIENPFYAATALTSATHVYLQLPDFQKQCRALVRIELHSQSICSVWGEY